jgi:dipeptidyl aminopeptidase/acylaminoacyl peptidase
MQRFRRAAFLSLLIILSLGLCAGAQAKRPMSLVDMLEVPNLADPQLSPDGKQILFALGKADWKANTRISHIWRINTDGTGLIQMTNGAKGESSPRWSPDGTTIAFLARRSSVSGASDGGEEMTQIFLLGNLGGEARQLTRHATSVSNIRWFPSGDAIYFLASDPKTAEEKEREKQKDDVYAYDENFKQTHLWKITIADEKEAQLTSGDFSITTYSLSQDGDKIVATRAPSPLYGDQDMGEIYIIDSSGKNEIRLTNNRVEEINVRLSPDKREVLLIAGADQNFEPYFNSNLFLTPASRGSTQLVLPDFPCAIDAAEWSSDGKSVYLITNMGVHAELQVLDLATKKVRRLTDGPHAITPGSLSSRGDRHVFALSDPTNPGEVYIFGPGDPAPVQVTHVFDYLSRDFKLPRMEKVQWKGSDGATVEGVLTYPLDYEEGKRYPLVVCTHGGPQASDKLTFGSWSQYRPVLAARGYAILQPNYRGSTGYGNAFLRDMVGHYFRQAHLDVMTGVDYLIQRDIADPDRMVKMGWSGGGHMTNKIITFADRFKAASSGAGAANWISMYAQSDVRSFRTPWFGGTPWQKDAPIAAYWDNSPLKDVWKVKTPTIFLVGEKDVRVPMPQSVEMYRALKSNGIPTHLYIAPREPHGWGELRHELFKMNVELEWFEKYATKRPYTWEKAPADSDRLK